MSGVGGGPALGGAVGQVPLYPIGEGGMAAVPGSAGFLNPYVGANACLFPNELQGILLVILAGGTVTIGLAPGTANNVTPTAAPATLPSIANPAGYPPLQWPIFFKRGAFPYLQLTAGNAYYQWF